MPTSTRGTSSNGRSSPTANVVEAQYRLSAGGTQRKRARAEATMMHASPCAKRSVRRPLGRVLARDEVHHGPRVPSELRCEHKHAAGLRHGERGVLARGERLLDGLRPFGGIQLCSDTMNEHGASRI